MINVCRYCFRLNPLDKGECLYCAEDCQAMESADYSQFRQKQLEILRQEEEKFQAEIGDYPDLKVFEDCANLSSSEEVIFARP